MIMEFLFGYLIELVTPVFTLGIPSGNQQDSPWTGASTGINLEVTPVIGIL